MDREVSQAFDEVRRRIRDLDEHVDKIPVRMPSGGGGGTQLRSFQVVSIQDDYITCNTWVPSTETAGSDDVYVAKPYLLRTTPFDTIAITYQNGDEITYTYDTERRRLATLTAVGTDPEEFQVVTPDYYVGEIVVAKNGKSGVLFDEGGEDEAPIIWEDINQAARLWARE